MTPIRASFLVLVILLLVQTLRLQSAHSTIESMKVASKQSEVLAQAQNDKVEQTTKDRANEADAKTAVAVARAAPAIDRYVRVHTVGATCKAAPAPAGDPAPRDDGPGLAAGMVAVPREDFEHYVNQSLRLKEVHDFGLKLVQEGLAVESTSAPLEP